MASERPIRRKPCSHANNFESLIAFRNTYVWGGGGDGGRRGWGRFQWFSGCNILTVIFFLFFFFLLVYPISLSLSPQPRKKKKKKNPQTPPPKKKTPKNACTRTPKFLCIFLRNARPLPPPPSPHTNGNSFKVLLQASVPGWGGGVWCLAPQMGTAAWTKGETKCP